MQGWNAYSPMGPIYLPNPKIPTFMSPVPLNYIDCVLDPTETTGGLFLGDLVSARKPEVLFQNTIRAILSCGDESNEGPLAPGCTAIEDLKVLTAKDLYDYDMSQHFDETYEFIERNLLSKRNTLVHCHAGRSRSVTVVAAYLMRKFQWTCQQALAHIKTRRPRAKPNDSFVTQLKQFEAKLLSQKGVEVPALVEPPVAMVNGPSTPQKEPRIQPTDVSSHSPQTGNPYQNYQAPYSMSAPQYSKQAQYPQYNPYLSYSNPPQYYGGYPNMLPRQGVYSSQTNMPANPYRQSSVGGFYPPNMRPLSPNPLGSYNPYLNSVMPQWR